MVTNEEIVEDSETQESEKEEQKIRLTRSVFCFTFSLTGDWRRLSLGLLILLSVIELCSMTKLPGLAAQHPP